MSRKPYCGCLCHHPIPTGGIICHCDCREALLAITPYNQEQARKIKALEEENERLKAQLQQSQDKHCDISGVKLDSKPKTVSVSYVPRPPFIQLKGFVK